MRNVSRRDTTRLLKSLPTIEPPAGLAERIKAEIPPQIEFTGLRMESGTTHPVVRLKSQIRSLAIAASLTIVVASVGYSTKQILDGSELWDRLAGVRHPSPEELVIIVPPRSAVERQAVVVGMDIARVPGETSGQEPGGSLMRARIVVHDTEGHPCQGMWVKISPPVATPSIPEVECKVDANGIATFNSLPSSFYHVAVTREDDNRKFRVAALFDDKPRIPSTPVPDDENVVTTSELKPLSVARSSLVSQYLVAPQCR